MGTRCIVEVTGRISEEDKIETVATIYRQFDGYPSGMGDDIKEALSGRTVVNGYQDEATQLNGYGCLAAFLVANLKGNRCGNVYLYPIGRRGCGEEYVYTIFAQAGLPVNMKIESCYGDGQVIYDGPLEEFDSSSINEDLD